MASNKKESFFDKVKGDKKYKAKVELIGYGIFIVVLVLGLNISSLGDNSNRSDLGNVIDKGSLNEREEENTSMDEESLLKKLSDNYSYEVLVNITKKSMNIETNEEVDVESKISYKGKSYGKTKEINYINGNDKSIYYKVDDSYYSRQDNITSLVKDTQVYDVIEGKYIEMDSIKEMINKASLDYVTNFSDGRKEMVYHMLVKDFIVSHHSNISVDEKIEISVIEEGEVLSIIVDYSNAYPYIDESISSCKVDVKVKDIGNVEEFDVVVSREEVSDEENTSIE